MNTKTKNLAVRTVTGILYVAIMVICFMRPLGMVFVFALITAMTVRELCSIVNEREDVAVNSFICGVAGVFLMLAMFGFCSGLTPAIVFIPYLITIIYLFVSELYLRQADALNNMAYAMLSQLYIALPLSTINILAYYRGEYYYLLPLAVFVFLWCNDTGAYVAGSLFGRHKLFPRISPGKTWEGCIGGAVLVLAVSTLVWRIEPGNVSGLSLPQWLGLGLVVVVFGTWGDLIESLLKRTLRIKDSGNILPGHG
ncbi:MAG: phosphatidate cytidylyltransferase, partial [Prevotella sp.]|nr:phosphatidate cytidylyltransferase [Prevotella sp.]